MAYFHVRSGLQSHNLCSKTVSFRLNFPIEYPGPRAWTNVVRSCATSTNPILVSHCWGPRAGLSNIQSPGADRELELDCISSPFWD